MEMLLEIFKVVVLMIIYIPYKIYRSGLSGLLRDSFSSPGSVVPPTAKKRSRPSPRRLKRSSYVITEKNWYIVYSPTSNQTLETLGKHCDDTSPLVVCRYPTREDLFKEMRRNKTRLVANPTRMRKGNDRQEEN